MYVHTHTYKMKQKKHVTWAGDKCEIQACNEDTQTTKYGTSEERERERGGETRIKEW